MLKRAQRLAEAKRKACSEKRPPKPAASRDFSLKESPLTRILAFNVGRGQAASNMQAVSKAAVSEAGIGNVTKRYFAALAPKFPKVWFSRVLSSPGARIHRDSCSAWQARWSQAQRGHLRWGRVGSVPPTSRKRFTGQPVVLLGMLLGFSKANVVILVAVVLTV